MASSASGVYESPAEQRQWRLELRCPGQAAHCSPLATVKRLTGYRRLIVKIKLRHEIRLGAEGWQGNLLNH